MMKNLLFLGMLSFSLTTNAQSNFWDKTKGVFHSYRINGFEYEQLIKEKDFLAENNVRQRTKIYYNKKYRSFSTEEFDKNGRVTRVEKAYSSPNKKYITEYFYNDNHQLIKKQFINPKGQTSITHIAYDKNNKILSMISKGIDSKYRATFYQYDEQGNKILTEIFFKDSIHPVTSLEQNYYEDGSKKSTIYRKKGKIKYEWNYDCKPDGELVNVKQKDQSTICVKEEKDADGNRVVWKKEFDEKGKLTKIKSVYQSDSIFIKSETFDLNGRLTKTTEKNTSGGFKTLFFNKKGAVTSHYETILNENKQEEKYISQYGNYHYTRINKYTDHLKTLAVGINKKSTSVEEYEYKFY